MSKHPCQNDKCDNSWHRTAVCPKTNRSTNSTAQNASNAKKNPLNNSRSKIHNSYKQHQYRVGQAIALCQKLDPSSRAEEYTGYSLGIILNEYPEDPQVYQTVSNFIKTMDLLERRSRDELKAFATGYQMSLPDEVYEVDNTGVSAAVDMMTDYQIATMIFHNDAQITTEFRRQAEFEGKVIEPDLAMSALKEIFDFKKDTFNKLCEKGLFKEAVQRVVGDTKIVVPLAIKYIDWTTEELTELEELLEEHHSLMNDSRLALPDASEEINNQNLAASLASIRAHPNASDVNKAIHVLDT